MEKSRKNPPGEEWSQEGRISITLAPLLEGRWRPRELRSGAYDEPIGRRYQHIGGFLADDHVSVGRM